MLTVQTPRRLRILHIEPSAADHAKARSALELNGSDYDIERIETLAELDQRLDRQVCDVIVSAYHVDGFTAMDAWDVVLGASGVQPPFIVLSDSASEADAIDAILRLVAAPAEKLTRIVYNLSAFAPSAACAAQATSVLSIPPLKATTRHRRRRPPRSALRTRPS